jgi:hypothetical protein
MQVIKTYPGTRRFAAIHGCLDKLPARLRHERTNA